MSYQENRYKILNKELHNQYGIIISDLSRIREKFEKHLYLIKRTQFEQLYDDIEFRVNELDELIKSLREEREIFLIESK